MVGIYFFNNKAQKIVNRLSKSNRGELEITDLNNIFKNEVYKSKTS